METSIPGFLYERIPEKDPPKKDPPKKETRTTDTETKPHMEEKQE